MGELRGLRRRSLVVAGMLSLAIVPGVAGAGAGTTEPPTASTPSDSAAITEPDGSVAPDEPVDTEPVATEPVEESAPTEPVPADTIEPDESVAPDEPVETEPVATEPVEESAPADTTEPTVSTIEPADDDFSITPLALIDVPNPGAITVPAAGSAEQIGPASPYPSTVTVTGQTGVVTIVTLQLFDVSHQISGDLDILLVGPEGDSLIVMSDISHSSYSALQNANITFADTGTAPPESGIITGSHTWRTTNNNPDGASDDFPSPAPSPGSATTFATAFAGTEPNGTWSLYIVDDATGDVGTIAGGWNLTVDSEEEAVGTTTSIESTPNPSLVGGDVTFTATVLAGTTPVTAGTVTFRNGATVLAADVPVTTSGQASFATSDLTENTHTISATFNGASGFLTSSGTTSQVVDAPTTTPATGQWCNTGSITVPGSGPATPYPSRITVAGAGTSTLR